MTLLSRQWDTAEAIRDTLLADQDLLGAGYKWLARKLPMHRGAKWAAGAYVVPVTPNELPNETQIDRIDYRFVSAIVNPVEQKLESGASAHAAAIERVEDIFRNKAGRQAPPLLAALSTDGMSFQLSTVVPADRFIAGAFQLGYDASATMVVIRVNVPRRDVSKLGAP